MRSWSEISLGSPMFWYSFSEMGFSVNPMSCKASTSSVLMSFEEANFRPENMKSLKKTPT